ncbi:hypothetical protein ACWC9T_34685, partial [Kitasatospora sp. NPDC001159]
MSWNDEVSCCCGMTPGPLSPRGQGGSAKSGPACTLVELFNLLAHFFANGGGGPGPAGATESEVDEQAWERALGTSRLAAALEP